MTTQEGTPSHATETPVTDVFTVEGSSHEYTSWQAARAAAAAQVQRLRRSVQIFRNGLIYDFKRY